MKSINFRKIYDIKEKIYEIYEYFRPSKARFHILLAGLTGSEPLRASARRDDHQRPTIRQEGCLPQAQILENMHLSLVSMHLSIINCCFYPFWPILSKF